jgi:hypothetical protein
MYRNRTGLRNTPQAHLDWHVRLLRLVHQTYRSISGHAEGRGRTVGQAPSFRPPGSSGARPSEIVSSLVRPTLHVPLS